MSSPRPPSWAEHLRVFRCTDCKVVSTAYGWEAWQLTFEPADGGDDCRFTDRIVFGIRTLARARVVLKAFGVNKDKNPPQGVPNNIMPQDLFGKLVKIALDEHCHIMDRGYAYEQA